ncbi:hypothetical protein Hdeb2414_s0002g00056901 [Helianthus debilis subsp. tardiflorus]
MKTEPGHQRHTREARIEPITHQVSGCFYNTSTINQVQQQPDQKAYPPPQPRQPTV